MLHRHSKSPVHSNRRPAHNFFYLSDDERVTSTAATAVQLFCSMISGFHALSITESLENHTGIRLLICYCPLLINYVSLVLPY